MKRSTVGLAAIGIVVGCAWPVTAQDAVFRAAPTFGLPGLSSDATSLLVVADVGSFAGPPDGIPDVIVGSQNQVAATLFGRADGSLAGGPNTPLGRIPAALALADFTGDGALDMLVADTGNDLVCFRGFDDGPPFQQLGAPFAVGTNPVGIATFDFDDDGQTDIAVLNRGGQATGEIRILYGNGDCTFDPPPFPRASSIDAGLGSGAFVLDDLNGDGIPDFAVANTLGNDVSIILGDAEGGFREAQRISVVPVGGTAIVEPVAIASATLNGDPHKDLVVVNRNSDEVAILLGSANGTFATPRFFASGSSGSSPTSLALADIDGDGRTDVIVANNRSSDVSALLGDGQGNLRRARSFVADQEPMAVAVANLSGAGLPDVIVNSRGTQGPTAAVLRSLGGGTLASIENVATDPSPNSFAVGDLDNDGFADLAVAQSDGLVLLLRSLGGAGFAPLASGPLVVAGSVSAVVAADFDGDLMTDVAVATAVPGVVSLFRGRPGGRFAEPITIEVGPGISAMVAGDWNRDGIADLGLTRQLGDERGVVEVLMGSATGLSHGQSVTVGITPIDVATGDFNADGLADIAVANSVSATVSVLRGRGDGSFDEPASVILSGAARSLTVADFDRDGCDDFAVGLSMNGRVVPYFGACDATFVAGPQALSAAQSPAGIAARDFSGDGIADIVIADEVDNRLTLFTKRAGDRFFVNLRNDVYTLSRRPIRAHSGDFDGDGRYDAAAMNSFVAGSVSILTNVVAPAALRGDANGDALRTAADIVAVLRTVMGQAGKRVEDVSQGSVLGGNTDANGDGVISRQDARAAAVRLFPRS